VRPRPSAGPPPPPDAGRRQAPTRARWGPQCRHSARWRSRWGRRHRRRRTSSEVFVREGAPRRCRSRTSRPRGPAEVHARSSGARHRCAARAFREAGQHLRRALVGRIACEHLLELARGRPAPPRRQQRADEVETVGLDPRRQPRGALELEEAAVRVSGAHEGRSVVVRHRGVAGQSARRFRERRQRAPGIPRRQETPPLLVARPVLRPRDPGQIRRLRLGGRCGRSRGYVIRSRSGQGPPRRGAQRSPNDDSGGKRHQRDGRTSEGEAAALDPVGAAPPAVWRGRRRRRGRLRTKARTASRAGRAAEEVPLAAARADPESARPSAVSGGRHGSRHVEAASRKALSLPTRSSDPA